MTKILITGGAGYIGSHTVKELIRSGYTDLVIIDDLSKGEMARLDKEIPFFKGDFADDKILDQIFSEKIDAVLHFAAYKSAPESVVKPDKYYENNVEKSIHFLNRCLKEGVNNFIFSSSAAVYGDVDGYPITETFEAKPTNPYGWTKLIFEQTLTDVSNATDMGHVSLRYFNAGGADPEGQLGNDHSKGEDVISALMRSATNKSDFSILGTDYDTKDGTCVRDMIHVTDLATAHIAALKYLENGGSSSVINLGSEQGFTVKEMAGSTQKVTKQKFNIVDGERREGDIVTSIASSERAKALLDWEQSHSSLEEIIETAWLWETVGKSK